MLAPVAMCKTGFTRAALGRNIKLLFNKRCVASAAGVAHAARSFGRRGRGCRAWVVRVFVMERGVICAKAL
eukprot:2351901-Prymnesium_polylepis.1